MIDKEMELKEITEPQIFNPPKEMLVWDLHKSDATRQYVAAIIPGVSYPVTTVRGNKRGACFVHCAEIPEEPKTHRATCRELAKWLAQGNGQVSLKPDRASTAVAKSIEARTATAYVYGGGDNDELEKQVIVRKWDDDEWHEPTADYMNLEDK